MPCDASPLLPICFWLALVGDGSPTWLHPLSHQLAIVIVIIRFTGTEPFLLGAFRSLQACVTLQVVGVSPAAASGPSGSREAGSLGSQVSTRPEQNVLCPAPGTGQPAAHGAGEGGPLPSGFRRCLVFDNVCSCAGA